MNRQPVLEGERVLLRPLIEADWDALYAVAADRELWARHPSHDRWQEPVFRAFFDDALAKGGALAIVNRGPTPYDDVAEVRIDGGAGDVLSTLPRA